MPLRESFQDIGALGGGAGGSFGSSDVLSDLTDQPGHRILWVAAAMAGGTDLLSDVGKPVLVFEAVPNWCPGGLEMVPQALLFVNTPRAPESGTIFKANNHTQVLGRSNMFGIDMPLVLSSELTCVASFHG